jgi:PAS domain S-box-containing protein
MTQLDRIHDSLLGAPSHWWMRYLVSGLFTLLSIFIVAVLWRGFSAISDPGLILLLTVAAATYLAGGMAGMLSAAFVLFCSFVLFSHPLYPFRYSDMDWRQMMVIIVACPIIALMVGSLKEQVDLLKIVSREAQGLKDELRRLDGARETQHLCEQRFRLMTECMPEYAVCVLDSSGLISSWNPGAERLLGYSDHEIVGQSYSRFFSREDLLGRQPERLLEQAHFYGFAVEEGWRMCKGGGRIRAATTLTVMRNSQGAEAGSLMVMRVIPPATDKPDLSRKS